jgi:protein CpxP
MDNTKLLKAIVLILLLVNTATISFLWITKPPRPNKQDNAKEFLSNELSFDAKQQEQLEDLRTNFFESREELRKEINDKTDAYFALLQNPKIDSATVKKAAKEIIAIKEKEELAVFYHFQKVRALCTDNQKQKFDKIIMEAARMMGPNQREGHGPPPRCERHDPPPPPSSMDIQCPPPPRK